MRLYGVVIGTAAIAALSACGGSGGSPPGPVPNPAPTPVVLVPGSVAQYSGTDTIVHVFASPTSRQTNYTAAYTFKATRSVLAAAAGASAAFDVNTVATYTATQDPGTGTLETSNTSDAYENQVAVAGGTSVQQVGAQSIVTATDESAGALGGGPFTQIVATTTAYHSPRINGVYPLVAGASVAEPIGRTVKSSTTDANGATMDTTTVFDVASSDLVNSDGSFDLVQQLSNGESQTTIESSNGSGSVNAGGPLYALSDTIGVPTHGGSGYAIPVTVLRQSVATGATPAPTATTAAYAAADWYPGGALPASPLQTDTVTVKGPATSLPAACAGASTQPNVYEIDTSTSTLDIDADYATETQQSFNSNGTPVCVVRTQTTKNYALTTGLLSQTVTETYAEVLTSLSGTASAGGMVRKR